MNEQDFNQEIANILLEDEDFQTSIKSDYSKSDCEKINAFLCDVSFDFELIDELTDWIGNEISDGTKVLAFGWDSDGWGPGGNGAIWYYSRFGLVSMCSSDYEGHTSVFDKSTWYPKDIGYIGNDYIDIDSDVYSTEEIIQLLKIDTTKIENHVVINGQSIEN